VNSRRSRNEERLHGTQRWPRVFLGVARLTSWYDIGQCVTPAFTERRDVLLCKFPFSLFTAICAAVIVGKLYIEPLRVGKIIHWSH